MYLFEPIYNELNTNPNIEFSDPEPRCPKDVVVSCVKNFSNCKQGLDVQCEQKISFFVASRGWKHLYPKFYIQRSGNRSGVIREYDTVLLWLIQNKFVTKKGLVKT